jgi:BirA family biotin operon repressor/biotin-[acetyl-CoA-carboxylase] ligase
VTTPTNKSSGLLADSAVLNSLINEAKISAQVEVLAQVDSTQKVLLSREPSELAPGLTLITNHQTAGIGRLGRNWESEPGDSVLMSYVFHTDSRLLPLFVGNTVAEALNKYLPFVKLKWPNDIVIELNGNTRKLGGIVLQRHEKDPNIVVAGIGINLKFSGSRPTQEAISLSELVEKLPDVNQLIFEIIQQLNNQVSNLIELYKRCCSTIGKDVVVQMLNAPDVVGRAVDISSTGGLVIETSDGKVEVQTGDVKHLRTSE